MPFVNFGAFFLRHMVILHQRVSYDLCTQSGHDTFILQVHLCLNLKSVIENVYSCICVIHLKVWKLE